MYQNKSLELISKVSNTLSYLNLLHKAQSRVRGLVEERKGWAPSNPALCAGHGYSMTWNYK